MSALRSIAGRGFWMAACGTLIALFVLASGALVFESVQKPDAHAAREASDDPDATAPTSRSAPQEHVVALDREAQEKGGVETKPPVAVPYRDRLKVYGLVLGLERLTPLYNSAMTDEAQLQAADAKLKASRTANERARDVLKVFATAKAQAEAAQAAFELDAAGLAQAQAQIAALKNTAVQEWGSVLGEAIAGRSRLAGDLVSRHLVLVQISLPIGSAAPPPRLLLSSGVSTSVEGVLVSEAPQVDAKIQGATFLYAVPAARGFVPGASIVADLIKGEPQPGIDIPPSAVIWQAGKPWMYLRTAEDRFERHAIDDIAAPTREGGYIVPATSMPQDQPVVVAGAQILLSQEMRAQIPSDEDDH